MVKNIFIAAFIFVLSAFNLSAQVPEPANPNGKQQKVRTVTIPISIFTQKELKENQAEEFIQADRIIVREDKDEQTILSIRSVSAAPLEIAFLVQDDLTSEFNLQLQDLAKFIRSLPRGSRVMVAYLRGGSMQVRQKFTDDLAKAAASLRIVVGSSAAPRSPFDGVQDALKKFDALPNGRRAIVLISDGLDASGGVENTTPSNSIDLSSAILKAQRRSVAVYTIYSPASLTGEGGNSLLILNGQSSLEKLSEETGGRAFFQGTIAPISFQPFFKDLNLMLNRQFALTYLSTHMKKGYHKVDVASTNPEIKIQHPKGYYFK